MKRKTEPLNHFDEVIREVYFSAVFCCQGSHRCKPIQNLFSVITFILSLNQCFYPEGSSLPPSSGHKGSLNGENYVAHGVDFTVTRCQLSWTSMGFLEIPCQTVLFTTTIKTPNQGIHHEKIVFIPPVEIFDFKAQCSCGLKQFFFTVFAFSLFQVSENQRNFRYSSSGHNMRLYFYWICKFDLKYLQAVRIEISGNKKKRSNWINSANQNQAANELSAFAGNFTGTAIMSSRAVSLHLL